MLKARNITFFRIMTAGYISAHTFSRLYPKKILNELSFSDCFKYDTISCEELKEIFEREEIMENLYYIEKMDEALSKYPMPLYNVVEKCLNTASHDVCNIITLLGKKAFLSDYLFCTKQSFSNLNFITDDNKYEMRLFALSVAKECKEYLNNSSLEMLPIKESEADIKNSKKYEINDDINNFFHEPFGFYDDNIFGQGFNSKDTIIIDDDALSAGNTHYKKYVLYLYSVNYEDFNVFEDYLISHIKCIGNIRISNCIKALGIRAFYVNYLFADNKKLYQIRNLGRKSILELIKIRPLIIEFVIQQYKISNTSTFDEKVEQTSLLEKQPLKKRIGDLKYSLMEMKLHKMMNGVSVRARNTINNYEGDFLDEFVYKKSCVMNLNKAGKKTADEIIQLISELSDFLLFLTGNDIQESELNWLYYSFLYDGLLDDFVKEYYLRTGSLPILHILEKYFRSKQNERSFAVFNEVFALFENTYPKSMVSVAQIYGLSRERVRQICEKERSKIINILEKKMDETSDESISVYRNKKDLESLKKRLASKTIWTIDNIREFAEIEDLTLSSNFLIYILSCLFNDSYSIMGLNPLAVKQDNELWKYTYLVGKNYIESFDFEKMLMIIDDYKVNSTESITQSVSELLINLFSEAWFDYNYALVEDIEQIVSLLLVEEKGIVPDISFNFTIEGQMEESVCDVFYKILKDNGKPIELEKLFNMYNEEYPNRYKNVNSIRHIINEDSRICFLGTESLVALFEWKHVHIGSIRDLIVSFLNEFDEPQHISLIVEHIMSIRNSTEKSIRSTMSSGKQFCQFPGGYYGLKDKEYPEFYSLSEFEQNSRKKLLIFEQFIQDNNRFPLSSSQDIEEQSLARWWGKVLRTKNRTDFLSNEVKRIEHNYQMLPRTKSDYVWFERLEEYKLFLLEKRRKPGTYTEHEIELSRWFNKSLNDVQNGSMPKQREYAFIQLSKIL